MFIISTKSLFFNPSYLPREAEKLVGAKIDDVDRHFLRNFTIFQACLIEKIYLPRFCYHTSLSIAGNCRMCLVEEKSTIKPVASCAVNIDGNMEIYTCTVMVKKARESVLEYLLINHPLDCPICDQGGECDLQDQTMVFGADRGRFYEDKRTVTNKNFGFLIKTFFNRCIYCARCTRFMQELGGVETLGMLGRGLHSEIGTYFNEFLTSEVSGNIIDLCPVGALTSKPYAYRARVWELVPIEGFDIIDSFGATIKMECRGLEVMRVLPASNDVLNEEWISDRSRFFYDSLQLQRLTTPLFHKKKMYKEVSWSQSLRILRTFFLRHLRWAQRERKALPLVVIQGALSDMETLVSCEDLVGFSGLLNFVVSYRQMSRQLKKQRALYTLRSARILEESTHYLLCGVHLRFESPIMNMKLVQFYGLNDVEIFILGKGTEINVEFHHLGSLITSTALGQLILDDYYSRTTKRLVLYGHNFLYSTELVSALHLFRAKFSFIGLNIVDIGAFEFGRVQENTKQNVKIFKQARITLSLAGDDHVWERFRAKTRQLQVYLGHHGGVGASTSNLILPTPVFIEKSSSFLNNCAFFLSSYTYEYRFNMKNPKEDWQIFRAVSDVLRFRRTFEYKTAEQLRRRLNYITPLQSTHGNFFRQLHYLPVVLNFLRSSFLKLNIKAAVPNFYKLNILCVMSQTLELCSRQYIDITKINELDNIA